MGDEDLRVAREFLFGVVEDDASGLPTRRYLKGSADRYGRQALVRLLRSDRPLAKEVREDLARLFDDRTVKPFEERRLVFMKVGAGGKKNIWLRCSLLSRSRNCARRGSSRMRRKQRSHSNSGFQRIPCGVLSGSSPVRLDLDVLRGIVGNSWNSCTSCGLD